MHKMFYVTAILLSDGGELMCWDLLSLGRNPSVCHDLMIYYRHESIRTMELIWSELQ